MAETLKSIYLESKQYFRDLKTRLDDGDTKELEASETKEIIEVSNFTIHHKDGFWKILSYWSSSVFI